MDGTTTPGVRPTFLTVLCILSFIAGAWSLWDSIESAFTNAPQEAVEEARLAIEEAMATLEGQGSNMVVGILESALDMAEKGVAHAKPLGYIGMATSILGLLGVWLMWNLKRKGFWIYVLASLSGLFLPFIFLGFSGAGLIGLGFGGFITILFIVFYGLNLKHMS